MLIFFTVACVALLKIVNRVHSASFSKSPGLRCNLGHGVLGKLDRLHGHLTKRPHRKFR